MCQRSLPSRRQLLRLPSSEGNPMRQTSCVRSESYQLACHLQMLTCWASLDMTFMSSLVLEYSANLTPSLHPLEINTAYFYCKFWFSRIFFVSTQGSSKCNVGFYFIGRIWFVTYWHLCDRGQNIPGFKILAHSLWCAIAPFTSMRYHMVSQNIVI